MSYISTERVAEIRKELKSTFPDFKFSITRQHHSTVSVVILEAPINLIIDSQKTNQSVNHFYIEETYKEHIEIRDILLKIYKIINEGNRTLTEDSDYGTVPLFYTDISIGKWDKPFIMVENKKTIKSVKKEMVAEVKEAPQQKTGEIQIIDYSERAIAVIGDTKPIKEKLKELGGRFNPHLTCGCGWIFSKSKLETLKTALAA